MNLFVDVLTVHDVTTPARQLFSYLLSHEKAYNMEVFCMVPVRVAALNDSDCGEHDTDSDASVKCFHVFHILQHILNYKFYEA
jgi:hypothetical protein